MKRCTFLEQHPDWSSSGISTDPAVVSHTASCAICRETVETWQTVEQSILAVERDASLHDAPVASVAERLVRRARSQDKRRAPERKIKWVAAAVAATLTAAVLAGMQLFLEPTQLPSPNQPEVFGTVSMVTQNGAKSVNIDPAHSKITVPDTGRATAEIGPDLLGIGGGAQVQVEKAGDTETRISLLRGILAVQAARRRAGTSFVVVSGKVRIRVVGTRFSVARRQGNLTEVAVSEGRVEVVDANGRVFIVDANYRLRTGPDDTSIFPIRGTDKTLIDSLFLKYDASSALARDIDSLPNSGENPQPQKNESDTAEEDEHRSETVPALSGLTGYEKNRAQWRSWILAGRIDDAESALLSQVRKHPDDVVSWSLLADCFRKTENWQRALTALEEVETRGSRADAKRAQFRAGVILQDRFGDHRSAAKKFEAYIQSKGSPLKAEASLRLAASYLALNRKPDARKLLEGVVHSHGGTSAAETAQKMLLDL